MRSVRRAISLALPLLIALSALVPCVCPVLPASEAGAHGCCGPGPGIRAAVPDCCASMREAFPGVSAAGPLEGISPALAAVLLPDAAPSPAPCSRPRAAAVAPSPPTVLRV
jgi:hypothetical protein